MVEVDTQLYKQLHKLSSIKSEEELEKLLTLLWKSRKNGVTPPEKSLVQSLLRLRSATEVDPVLACLRLFIRKWVREDSSSNDIVKLFPPDLSLELQHMLIMLLQKYETQWKVELSSDQHLTGRTRLSSQVNADLLPPLISSPATSGSLRPQQDNTISLFNSHHLAASAQIITESNASHLSPIPSQQDGSGPHRLDMLPRLKSMTWTMEKHNMNPGKRVAIITLKLQDYNKSLLGETEVKFRLTRDTLEAMLRSMTDISEQLSSYVKSSEPSQKKQRQ